MKQKFGLLVCKGTNNLGDEIQSLAARRFLPSVDFELDRDGLPGDEELDDQVKVIMNGWFMHITERLRWPPPKNLFPLITSFHISPNVLDILLSDIGLNYLKAYEPIGCRDLYTLGLLRRRGIESFFSGCLTITLERPNVERDDNLIVANDVSEAMLVRVAKETDKNIVFTTHMDYAHQDVELRMKKAEQLLALYAKASCVITTRLHCALPCVAMNTPVLLINRATDTERFFGLNTFVINTSESEYLESGKFYYDFDHPMANPINHLSYRESLISSVVRFTS